MAGASSVSMHLEGFPELLEKLRNLNVRAKAIESAALRAGAQPIYEDAYKRAPVLTGRGRDAITIKTIRREAGGWQTISVGIHKEELDRGYHMIYQEYGTSRMSPHPFLGPAYAAQKTHAYEIMRGIIQKGLGL